MSTVTVHVEVTQEDIDQGKRGHCWTCPVALAMNRALLPVPVEVGGYLFYLSDEIRRAFDLPAAALRFITWFDSRDQEMRDRAKPFSFDVEIPAEYLTVEAAQ